MYDTVNLLKDVHLEGNDYHIIFKYRLGSGNLSFPKTIDFTGNDVSFPDASIDFNSKQKKCILSYLREHYGMPQFNIDDVERTLREYWQIPI